MTVFSPLSSSNGSCQTWYFETRPLNTPTRSWLRFSNPWWMRVIPFVSIIGNHDVESPFMSASHIHNYPRRARPQVASPGEGALIAGNVLVRVEDQNGNPLWNVWLLDYMHRFTTRQCQSYSLHTCAPRIRFDPVCQAWFPFGNWGHAL